ncbi:uncharacterized protein LOC117644952 [Thrips palmi]|uniref:Uncharacterized protein LOC117644952 n=1 Tax=Thrips palmi TaxID=161013 RepID=A0A6P8YLA5_THRPL|nr:uncharacterized protein LOC117644952 [Thrips palmi]
MDLLLLPDEVLLAVLAHLEPRQLLQCRALCRRLRDLCLHRRLWQTADVSDLFLLRAALNLAPCLGEVRVTNPEAVAYLVQGTACVVSDLSVEVGSQLDAAFATTIVGKLSALGGAKKLSLHFHCPLPTPSVATLLKAVVHIDGLQELQVFGTGAFDPMEAVLPLSDLELRPSLRKLSYWSREVDPCLDLLLKTHAPTLEEVFLFFLHEIPTTLLGSMPRLRVLACHPCDRLSELADLPSLESVRLMGARVTEDGAFCAGLVDFLRRSSHLRSVEFNGTRDVGSDAHLVALADSPSALHINAISGVDVAQGLLERVAATLPKFSLLKYLGLDSVPPNVVLKAISPETLPSLSVLSVRSTDRGMCLHAWLHDPAVQDVLVRNPNLHLYEAGMSTIPDNCACAWCRWGCHGTLQHFNYYSSHVRRADCPQKCFQVVGCSS